MSDFYGAARLEDWLAEEVFGVAIEAVPPAVVALCEKWRESIEINIQAWKDTDRGDGSGRASWRDWGRGFTPVSYPEVQPEFDAILKQAHEMMKANTMPTNPIGVVPASTPRMTDVRLVEIEALEAIRIRQSADLRSQVRANPQGVTIGAGFEWDDKEKQELLAEVRALKGDVSKYEKRIPELCREYLDQIEKLKKELEQARSTASQPTLGV